MPLRFSSASFLVSALLAFSFASAAAQESRPQRPPDGGVRVRLISIFIPSTPNAPFSATVNTESVRQLSDGTTIRLVNHRTIARDKAGRIFQERRMLVPDDGQHPSFLTQIEISDPVAHKLYICIPGEHTCQLETFDPPDFAPPATGAGPDREDLGKRLINGVETLGTLETKVIESGKIGNDSPIVMKVESWYSPKLGVNLVTKRQDPRTGNQNFDLSEITMSEPGADLFKVPEGYKVIDLRSR